MLKCTKCGRVLTYSQIRITADGRRFHEAKTPPDSEWDWTLCGPVEEKEVNTDVHERHRLDILEGYIEIGKNAIKDIIIKLDEEAMRDMNQGRPPDYRDLWFKLMRAIEVYE